MKYGFGRQHTSYLVAAGGAAALLLVGGVAGAQAGSNIGVTINGQPVHFQDIGPQQIEGRTLVPVRGVLEKLGAGISYNNATQVVTASTPTMDIQLKIGSRYAIVNANRVALDVPAQMIDDHTFVPLRFLGEALGANLKWNPDTRTVVITTRDYVPSDIAVDENALPDNDRQRDVDRTDETGSPRFRRRDRTGTNVPVRNLASPMINSFSTNAGDWLHMGQSLDATLEGTPGGEASFSIPGVAENIPMRETRPGHYVGRWQAPKNRRLELQAAPITANLTLDGRPALAFQATETLSLDTTPPRAFNMSPANNAVILDTRPIVSAAFDDQGSGIDTRALRLMFDSKDVTDQATVTNGTISYRPEVGLSPGTHVAELMLADKAGNLKNTSWIFKVRAREPHGIRTVTDNFDSVLRPGDTLRVELSGTPGGDATFSTGNIRDVPMTEDQPGHYVADYTVHRGDFVANQPITYRLIMPDGERFAQASLRTVRVGVSEGRLAAPTISWPRDDGDFANPMTVRGTAAPHARVAVRVDYRRRALGGLVAMSGTSIDTVVTADRNGDWETEPFRIGGLLGRSGVEYTVTATAMNGADQRSESTIMRFRAQ